MAVLCEAVVQSIFRCVTISDGEDYEQQTFDICNRQ